MKRATRSVSTCLLSAIALILLSAAAAAEPVIPPTLSGAAFHQDVPTVTSVTCSPDQPPRRVGGTFTARGTATGPYPGSFHETGEAFISIDEHGRATEYRLTASFVIDSPVGRVVGTKRSTNFGLSCGPVDDPDADSLAFNTDPSGFAATDTYEATIFTRSAAFADSGLFQVAFHDVFGFDERFRSALASPRQLLPTSKDQCKHGGWRDYGATFRNQGECVAFVVHH
jgi:hypothetical protein